MRSIFGHITAKLFVEVLAGCLSGICTGCNTTVITLVAGKRLLNTFHRLIFGTIFRHWISTFVMIRIAAIHTSGYKKKTKDRKWKFFCKIQCARCVTLVRSTLGPIRHPHNDYSALALYTSAFQSDADERNPPADDDRPTVRASRSQVLI